VLVRRPLRAAGPRPERAQWAGPGTNRCGTPWYSLERATRSRGSARYPPADASGERGRWVRVALRLCHSCARRRCPTRHRWRPARDPAPELDVLGDSAGRAARAISVDPYASRAASNRLHRPRVVITAMVNPGVVR
jgi:hypothetical protein